MKINKILNNFENYEKNNSDSNLRELVKNYERFILNTDEIVFNHSDIDWIKRRALRLHKNNSTLHEQLFKMTLEAQSPYVWIYDHLIIEQSKDIKELFKRLFLFQINNFFNNKKNKFNDLSINFNSFFFNCIFEDSLKNNINYVKNYFEYLQIINMIKESKNDTLKNFEKIKFFDKKYEQEKYIIFFTELLYKRIEEFAYDSIAAHDYFIINQASFNKILIDNICKQKDCLMIIDQLEAHLDEEKKNIKAKKI